MDENRRTMYDATVTIQVKVRNAETHLSNVPLEREVEEQLRERIGTQFNRGQVELTFTGLNVNNERPISQQQQQARGASR